MIGSFDNSEEDKKQIMRLAMGLPAQDPTTPAPAAGASGGGDSPIAGAAIGAGANLAAALFGAASRKAEENKKRAFDAEQQAYKAKAGAAQNLGVVQQNGLGQLMAQYRAALVR